jgi:GDP-4-dehydro-6-deoxy-D-mannose reductase
MRALLTGGSGFVGTALTRRLTEAGATVGHLTRGKTTTPPKAQVIALGEAPWSETAIATAIEAFKPDAIFHLAGGPRASRDDLYEANVLLAERLLAAAARSAAAARIVLIGSATEYGHPTAPDGVLNEDAECRPVTDYGIAKLAQTLHGLTRARAGQRISIARLFNPVGPRMPTHLAFAAFAERLATGSPTLAAGNIDVARDFFGVDEGARVIAEIAARDSAIGEVINVCSGVAQPLRPGVERMVARTGRRVQLVRDPGLVRFNDPPVIVGGVRKMIALGIRPASPDIGSALDALLDDAEAKERTLEAPAAVIRGR